MNTTLGDQICLSFDRALRTLFGRPKITDRENPAKYIKDCELSDDEKKHIAGLMRVNHAGEVCAQALYQGQALTARNPDIKIQMQQCADEENDHLDWCETRLKELGSHTSFLNPLWYAGSLCLGTVAGVIGDQWNLGFLAETEKQVTKHLQSHLSKLPEKDRKTRAIIEQMAIDESNHEEVANEKGARELPGVIQKLMTTTSKVMTSLAYKI